MYCSITKVFHILHCTFTLHCNLGIDKLCNKRKTLLNLIITSHFMSLDYFNICSFIGVVSFQELL